MGVIYTITNKINNKIYIGYTSNFIRRRGDHLKKLRINKHPNDHLQSSFNKYGEDSFIIEILEHYSSNLLLSMENYWCNLLNTHSRNYGYNIKPTGDGTNRQNSQETRDKLSKLAKNRENSGISTKCQEARVLALKGKPSRRKGIKLSEETKQKIKEARAKQVITEEHKKRISESMKGKNKKKKNYN
jgi:group I intron endonuclease